jgi:hypothetical protein
LERTVLHDITDNTELIEVTATALSAERLLECDLQPRLEVEIGLIYPSTYLNVVDVVAVPCGVEELVAESQNQNVLNHLLTEVVVDTEDLLLLPVGVQGLLEVARALKVLTEGLLDL